jgi:exonuclease SbcD
VIAIAGNHDSPALIDAPDPLARECGIVMIGYPNATVQTFDLPGFSILKSVPGLIEIKLRQFDYPVRILHTAYANEARLKEYLGEDKEERLNEILTRHWQQTAEEHCDNKGVNLMMAHLYMMKRGGEILEEPEGEKPIKIGNADLVYSEAVPLQIQYTALGHLHGYRNIGDEQKPIVYTSSPLAYSFSEAGQQKYVALVEAAPDVPVKVNKLALRSGKQLVRKTFDDIDTAVRWLSENRNTLVELTIESETFLTATERKSLNKAHSGIIHLIPKVKNLILEKGELKTINLSQGIRDLFKDYFKYRNNDQEPNEEIMKLFEEVLKEAN